jgi:hypothetical protein
VYSGSKIQLKENPLGRDSKKLHYPVSRGAINRHRESQRLKGMAESINQVKGETIAFRMVGQLPSLRPAKLLPTTTQEVVNYHF